MLKSIRLVNFYSFRDTTIELNQGTNVLVGINGSGKSNFLKVFELLNEAINGKRLRRHILEIGGVNEILYQGERENDEIVIELTFNNIVFLQKHEDEDEEISDKTEEVYYQIKIIPTQTEYYLEEKAWNERDEVYFHKEGEKVQMNSWYEYGKNEPINHNGLELFILSELFFRSHILSRRIFSHFLDTLKNLAYLTTINTTTQSPIRKPVLAIPETNIINGGDNLVQVLNTIKINDKKTYKKIIEALQRVNPYFKDFDFRPFGTNFEMLLEEEGLNRSIHLSKVSDGTLRYLCIVTALLTNKKAILCFDEPETGLHPDMLFNIAQAIKDAAKTAIVIVSTHSTQLLNYFDLENVRVFEKDADNSTQIYAYTEGSFEGWYETFQVGTMWRQGDIGGNRYGN